jgi:hypothetical protein
VRDRLVAGGRKVPTFQWAKSTVRTLVVRDANAGIRRADVAGDWPAIVERSKHDRLVALLGAPERRSHTGPRPGARKHLLTNGIGKCGVCGEVLRVARRNGRRDPTIIYTCNGKRGCVGRTKDLVDKVVASAVVKRLARPDALDWAVGDDDEARRALDRAKEIQRKLDAAADSHALDKISLRSLERITARWAPELAAAKLASSVAVRSVDIETLRKLAGPDAAVQWEAMTVSTKRAVLETLGVTVSILPRKLHGPGFEPETVDIAFRAG